MHTLDGNPERSGIACERFCGVAVEAFNRRESPLPKSRANVEGPPVSWVIGVKRLSNVQKPTADSRSTQPPLRMAQLTDGYSRDHQAGSMKARRPVILWTLANQMILLVYSLRGAC